MAYSRIINVTGVGPILFEKSDRASRLIISVKLSREIRVAIPNRASFKQALEFVEMKKPWIQRCLIRNKRLESRRRALSPPVVIDRVEARNTLTDRLCYLAKKHGFTYNKLTIRNQKTRWGSCSYRNNISLNMNLLLLPDELVDYVILHELVHTIIHDHSKRFWSELDKYVKNGKIMAKRLRLYDPNHKTP